METITVLNQNDYPLAVFTDPLKAIEKRNILTAFEDAREDAHNRSEQSGLMSPRRRFYHTRTVPLNPDLEELLVVKL